MKKRDPAVCYLLVAFWAMAFGDAASAQTARVFQRFVQEEFVLRWTAGPDAVAAIDDILAETNGALGQPGRLRRFARTPIIVACFATKLRREEGLQYIGRSNSVHFGAFVWDSLRGEAVVLDLAKALDDNPSDPAIADLASITRKLELGSLRSKDNDETKLLCQARAPGTEVDIALEYGAEDILSRAASPPGTGEEALVSWLVQRYRSAPNRRFEWLADFEVDMVAPAFTARVAHPDPLVMRVFNDPENARQFALRTQWRVKLLEEDD